MASKKMENVKVLPW